MLACSLHSALPGENRDVPTLLPAPDPPDGGLPSGAASLSSKAGVSSGLHIASLQAEHGLAIGHTHSTVCPVLGLVHSLYGHSELAPHAEPVLCAHRCPRPPRTSWRTARPTSGRTLSSSLCPRQRTRSGRRSSSAPSSDCAQQGASFSRRPVGTRMLIALGSPSVPARPCQPRSWEWVLSVPWFFSLH